MKKLILVFLFYFFVQCIEQTESRSDKTCPKNEVYLTCKRTCPPETCLSLIAKFRCQDPIPCVAGCSCQKGYLRMKQGEPCIPISQCRN